jgi:hypothetical protein
VTPGDGAYVCGSDGITEEEEEAAVGESKARALLDERLHVEHGPPDLAGQDGLVVDARQRPPHPRRAGVVPDARPG